MLTGSTGPVQADSAPGLESETQLRYFAWVESNRRKVDAASNGKLAYVYMPDTGGGGYESFVRYYYAQSGREGVIIDERFNGGGQAADYVIDVLLDPDRASFASAGVDVTDLDFAGIWDKSSEAAHVRTLIAEVDTPLRLSVPSPFGCLTSSLRPRAIPASLPASLTIS